MRGVQKCKQVQNLTQSMSNRSSQLSQDMIELRITSWTLQSGGELFQYNSTNYNERQQFRGVHFNLSMPTTEVYYFFHLIKKKQKEDRFEYYLQRRHELISDLQEDQPSGVSLLRLVGGVKLIRCHRKGKSFISAQPLSAFEIKRKPVVGKYQEMQTARPYLVVRTFKQGFPLRAGQLLRFGKVQFSILEINTSLMREVDYAEDDQHVLNLDCKDSFVPTTDKLTEEDSKLSQITRQCRVCLQGEQEEDNMLVTVCTCSGTGKYIHLECLREWIQHKLKKMRDSDGAFYQTSLLFCEICKSKFPKAIIKNGKTYGLLKFLEESTPYIALKGQDKLQADSTFYVAFQQTKSVTVGRLADNGVVLEEQSVSRRHARLEHQEEGMFVKDEVSKYGTLLNEKQVRFRIGNTIKAFQIGNAVFSLKIGESRNY